MERGGKKAAVCPSTIVPILKKHTDASGNREFYAY